MPRLDFWFRLFHHAALGLASVCLLYAEAFFLPGPLLLGLYLLAGLQVLAFGADGRRWVLPGWAANLLAGAVAGGGAAWIVVELNSQADWLADVGPAAMLPYIGPVLIGLVVVKLFRPRTPRDFRLLQGVGALQVALACVLATNSQSGLLFGVLLVAYIAFALGCLALNHFQEEQSTAKGPVADRLPFAYRMAPFCLRWTLAAATAAAPLFLLTPRIEGTNWDSATLAGPVAHGGDGGRTGFAETIDLNRSGAVQLGGEEVFRVAVVAPPGEAAPDLPPDQRWRGGVLDTYTNGRWSNAEIMQMDLGGRQPPSPAPPIWPGMYRLDFTLNSRAGGFFLAEPVRRSGAPVHATRVDLVESTGKLTPLIVSVRGPVLLPIVKGAHEYRYRQTAHVGDDPDRSAAEESKLYSDPLKVQKVAGLAEWTSGLLKRLADDPTYGLSAADVTPAPGFPSELPPDGWEHVGQALTRYLSRSGDYAYTLDLRRQDAGIDPLMDFLVNVKAGHCERFASALALMLRSQGIPSRVVVGFRGAGERSADGAYVVRENQAHAWVEMLVPAGTPAPNRPEGQSRSAQRLEWVTLDPTPASDLPPPTPYTLWDWWEDGQRTGQELWGGMVVNYSAEQQADLWATLQSPLTLTTLAGAGLSLAALAGVGGLMYAGFRRHRRSRGAARKSAAPHTAGYARLLALLARHGGPRPVPGQTPREFAAEARRFLQSLPTAATFAGLPDDVVDRLYRVRFGGRPPAAGEAAEGEARLDALAAVLRAAGSARR